MQVSLKTFMEFMSCSVIGFCIRLGPGLQIENAVFNAFFCGAKETYVVAQKLVYCCQSSVKLHYFDSQDTLIFYSSC